jgi:hypothetical protein
VKKAFGQENRVEDLLVLVAAEGWAKADRTTFTEVGE